MNHAGETKLLQANWRITLEIPDCLRQIDVFHWKCEIASGKLIFPAWFFNLPEVFCSRRWNHPFALGNWMPTKWLFCPPEAFFSYYVLKRYISWSYEVSTSWFFRPPEAFSRITYWKETCFEAMERRRLDSSVCLRLFLYHVLNRYVPWSYEVSTSWFFR